MGLRRSQTKGRVDPGPPAVEPASVISIIGACQHAELFAPWFKDAASWSAWFCFLKTMFAIPLTEAELEVFRRCTNRSAPAPGGYLEASLIIGRRGGKSLILALIAVYLACFYNWRPFLVAGERGSIVVVATDRRQAGVILRYIKAFLAIPPLAGMIDRETATEIDLNNLVTIEISTASFRTIRGKTCLACLCDELAFWLGDEASANPDTEIISALRPAMATIPKAMMLKASSPYARRGVLWTDFKRHFGRDDSATLVWQADTKTMNPSIPQSVIDAAYENDASDASAEYGAIFRSDIEAFVTREAAEACIVEHRYELPPAAGVLYTAFCDPSGGSNDSMTLAIAHREGALAILDAIREVKPPFSPESVVAEFAVLLKSYHINTVIGDRYAGLWPRERFQIHGITYNAAAKPKSDVYRDFLPAVNGRRVELLDHPKFIAQLCALERRTWRGGRDSIDHPPNQHDDVVNAVAGALTNLIVVAAPQPFFGVYGSGGYGFNGAYTTRDPNASASAVYASMPPEHWAAQGIFHPRDRQMWIDRGVYKPPSTEGSTK